MATAATHMSTGAQEIPRKKAMTATIWLTVLIFPHREAGITFPSAAARILNPETANSRPRIIRATQVLTRPASTRAKRAAVISSLSAMGSIS